jgi:glycosyltransferase involved in cell wall biosynthesis
MKIVAIHNFHREGSASGDDLVFKSETELLEVYGNEVVRYTISNDEYDNSSNIKKIMLSFGMLWSFKNFNNIKKLIAKENPDIVHIHTFFPLLSPSILYAAHRSGVKVVATLHDTRFICPCATSLRGIELCNKCADGHYCRMVKYNCFKNSKLQSLIIAFIFKYHRVRKSFYKNIDRYICLNENQISLLKSVGFDDKKIIKKYNFVPDFKISLEGSVDEKLPNRYVVFYGRIGEEKGIRFLMELWDKIDDIPLVVMGSGPLEEEFKVWVSKKNNVSFLGFTQHEKCLHIVAKSEFIIFPSIWYEGCSMVVIETESQGKGVIATDLGFSAEAIKNGINGYKVKLGDLFGFLEKVRFLWNSPKECKKLGENARRDYEKKYLPEDNYRQIINIYSDLLNN